MGLPPVDFPTLGWQVIAWIESMLCHGPGDVIGQPLLIDDEMALFICHAYRLDERTGRRRFRRAILSRPKGRAKSEIAGAIGCVETCPGAPARFDGWDARGDPVGRSVVSPFARILATEEGQTGNTYDNCRIMLTQGRIAEELAGLDAGLTRTFLPGNGEIRPSTAGASSKDGGKETWVCADEIHLYTLPELRSMHATVRRNMGAKRRESEPWGLDTTTMFLPGAGSVAETAYDAFAVLAYETLLDRGVLWDHAEAPAIVDWRDDEELLAALKVVYGPAGEWMDLDRVLQEIRDPDTTRADAERFFLNRVVRGDSSWIAPDEWRPLAVDRTIPDDALVTLGFDGAQFDDSTALIACEVETGLLQPVGVWERPEGPAGDEWQVDAAEVDAALAGAMKRWDVWRLYADPPHWQDRIDGWRGEHGADTVIDWWTNRDRQMAAAVERFESAVRGKTLEHTGDRTLAVHIGHCHVRKTRAGRLIVKERPRSPKKIDAAVAAVLAYEARMDAIAAGALTKRRKRRRRTDGKPRAAGF